MRLPVRILLGITPLWLAAPAFAQATPDGAAALRDGLTEMLKPILSAQVGGKPVFDGQVTVDPAGSVYRVRFPGVDTTVTAADKGTPKTMHLRCSGADYTATPQSGDTYRLEGDNPLRCTADVTGEKQPLTVNGSSVKTAMVVDLGRKQMTDGSWESSALTIQFGDPARTVTVDSSTMTSRMVPATSGRGDLTIHMEIQGLRSGDPSAVGSFSLAHAAYDVHAPDFDMGGILSAYGQSFGQLVAMVDRKPTDPMPAEVRAAVLDMYRKIFAAYGDAVEGTVSASDLKVTAPEAKIAIAGLTYGVKMTGLSGQAGGTGGLDIGLSGLAIDPPSPFAQWIPTDADIKLAGSQIPYGAVGQAYMSFIDAALSAGASGQPGGKKPGAADAAASAAMQQKMMQAYAQIGAALQQAGSQLDIRAFHITAPQAAIDLGGSVKADAAAKHGVTTALKLRLTNLDGLIKFVQGQPGGAQSAAGLTMVQTMGRQATTDDGRSARDYDIVVDAAGKILINGTDFAAFMPK